MSVVGHGIDLVEIESLKRTLSLPGDHFVQRCFTLAEQAQLDDRGDRVQRLAGRFAAKEAVAKAFGLGWGDNLAWTDIEVLSDANGCPCIVLHAEIARIGAETNVHVSISHDEAYAIASVVVVRGPGLDRCPRTAAPL